MQKIGILTINDDNNYGNRLQNYATQVIFEKNNFEVETISNKETNFGIKKAKNNVKNVIKRIIFNKTKYDRYNKFTQFNKNIKYSKYHIDKNHIPKDFEKHYDYFITGSDQVWNPTFDRTSDIDFLTFAPKVKRNSFSASFGISDIPNNLKEYYRKNLSEMNNISVREERGKEIIEELTGRKDVEVLVDPTMLLTAKEWDEVSKKPKQLKAKKYILNYFLGELSEKRKKEIRRIAEENNCEIIDILDKKSEFNQTGPSEFLYLEKNAFLICTDSFHSCVFAIIYNRPFIVFEREDKIVKMNSRIDTLLNKFKLENRRFDEKIGEELLKISYDKSYEILEEEKKKANEFLNKILNIKEC